MGIVVGNFNDVVSRARHYKVKVISRKKKPIQYIVGILSYALFIFLLLIGVTLLIYFVSIKIKQSKGDYSAPTFNGYVVLTGSMIPEIMEKDVVITKKIPAENLKVRDIITFASSDPRWKGTIITHRIIEKYKLNDGTYEFRSKGDNNNVADDALVQQENILGKVILTIPKLGYLQMFLATKSGWIIGILIPCLCVVSYDILKLFKVVGRKAGKRISKKKVTYVK